MSTALSFSPQPKPQKRLVDKTAVKKLTKMNDAQFRAAVFERDKGRCRKCLRVVVKSIELTENRAEVHHCHGRRGLLRHETRAALLLCASCHAEISGGVNCKVVIESTQTFQTVDGREWTDASCPVTFRRVI